MSDSRKLYEKEIENHLFNNLSELEDEFERFSKNSTQKSVESGVLDILARDDTDAPTVIEIKLGKAKHDSLGQILAYIADIEQELNTETVFGIIVAESFNKKLEHAVSGLWYIDLYEYELNFEFEKYRSREL